MKDLDSWQLIKRVFPHTRCFAIGGNPGLGKTYIAIEMGKNLSRKVYNVTLTEETPAAELRGHYIVKGGSFEWHDGPAVKAWREGGILIVNEVQRAGGDCLSFMLAITESKESAQMVLPSNEVIKPHPDFKCIATFNESLDTIPEALRDRFVITIHVKTPNPDAIAALPEYLRAAAQSSAAAEPARRLSLRAWFEFEALSDKVGHEIAAQAIFQKRAQDILNGLKLGERKKNVASTSPVEDDLEAVSKLIEDIAPSESTGPTIGFVAVTAKEIPIERIECPTCGFSNEAGRDTCADCGVDLEGEDEVE